MSLDNLFTAKQRDDQILMDNHADFDHDFETIKKAHRMGFIDDVTFMELQVLTPEYQKLKETL
ncbi:hypothetical protein KAR91_46465 [Candidatus Pacearchaeota archaeon]|nr:hypothetical protein [Candidatus Pacearchaeota archaeon]